MTADDLRVPDPDRLGAVQTLLSIPEPHDVGSEEEALFLEAMREIVAWHRDACPFYGRLLELEGFGPGDLRRAENLSGVPMVPADFFKTHEILSVPRDDVALHLTSSGTTGQKSQIFFDAWSIGCGRRLVDFVYAANGWNTPEESVNYLLYAYEPLPEMKLGTTNTNTFLTRYARVRNLRYALRATGDGRHDFDVFGCIETLTRYAEDDLPVRIFGFPAFVYFTLERMRDLGVPPVRFHPDSLVMFGGGWKGYADRAVPKEELRGMITELLGIPDGRIRESFGSVEHSIPYVDCEEHHLHVPVWSRVFIRDVATLEPVGYGEPGFLNFVSPYITSVPAQSVMMGDLAKLHPPEACGCGRTTPWFEILGRAGTSRNRSCAVAAAELLKR